MAFSGDLRNISLADVFQNVAGNRVTGTLQIKWRSNEHFVRFDQGLVTGYSTGFRKGLPFAEYVLQRGWVDGKKFEAARRKAGGRSRKPISRVLIEQKLLDEQQVHEIVSAMIEEHVYDLMLLKEASFELAEGDPPSRTFDADQRGAGVKLDVGPLLMEGARRCDEWERIHRVVSSDHDLFVLLEGWEDCELDEFGDEVAEYLDGHTPVSRLVELIAAGRFEILKVVAELVMRGGARPATAEEIRDRAQEAVSDKRLEDAESLLRRALELERSGADLRAQLADLLVDQGRSKDAASELATLGWQAAQEERLTEALGWYDKAIELDADDLVLRERRLELIVRLGEVEPIVAAVFDLVTVLVDMGLAERARNELRKNLERPGLKRHLGLMERLAEIDATLGDEVGAAQEYQDLAERVMPRDEQRGVELLRRALELRPDDELLAERIQDIESGRDLRRRTQRRRVASVAAVIAVLLGLSVAGVAEFLAASQMRRAFERSLTVADDADAGVEALRSLVAARGYAWTPSGMHADRLADRLINMQLQRIEEMIVAGDRAAATERIVCLQHEADSVRLGLSGQLASVRGRIEVEDAVDELLLRARREEPVALEKLRVFEDPRGLPLLLRVLPTMPEGSPRMAVLEAVTGLAGPDAGVTLARMFLAVEDEVAHERIRAWFERTAGGASRRSSAWNPVREFLLSESSAEAAEIVRRANELLQLVAVD